ncbi:barstar family protein [Uliginosibacterium sediminicola]|uniref:Barstar family protein n=1 Tax=Uliginosibacterium sediminicola TaxID=2024550 RepID=A0ABU9Z3J9_9RHOO
MKQHSTPRALLADAQASGIFQVPMQHAADIVSVAQALGFRVWALDLATLNDDAELLQALARVAEFPAWFGGNWDAAADCLNDLSWNPASGYLLSIHGSSRDLLRLQAGWTQLVDILGGASQLWKADNVPFWVLVEAPAQHLAPWPPKC